MANRSTLSPRPVAAEFDPRTGEVLIHDVAGLHPVNEAGWIAAEIIAAAAQAQRAREAALAVLPEPIPGLAPHEWPSVGGDPWAR